MNLGLQNKVALIGGASKGLGKGCAFQLAKEGVNVAICARCPETLKATAGLIKKNTGVKVLPLVADMSRTADIRRAVESALRAFKKIDILVVNSGGPPSGSFFELQEQDWRNAFNSVFYYVVELYRLVIPGMKKQKWGRIINITSLAVKEPSKNLVLSSVFRAGVVSLAKILSKELIEYNITINNVCPGVFKTERAVQLMMDRSKITGIPIKKIEKEIIDSLPLKRYQEPEELGDFAVFLASELAKGITGTTIQVDGGMASGLF